MAKIIENITNIEMEKIRREWDENNQKYYFSVVDVIGIVTESTDARNYWKVLKNRLKNTQKELVTECNQLKMRSNDGKFYLTDALDGAMLLKLIRLISPPNVAFFRVYFDELENLKKESYPQSQNAQLYNLNEEVENQLLVDGHETKDYIIVEALIAGALIENILISSTAEILTIKGNRIKPKSNSEISQENYSHEELYWGKFSRTIELPAEIEIDNVIATLSHGLLIIKLKKINKLLKKNIEVESI